MPQQVFQGTYTDKAGRPRTVTYRFKNSDRRTTAEALEWLRERNSLPSDDLTLNYVGAEADMPTMAQVMTKPTVRTVRAPNAD